MTSRALFPQWDIYTNSNRIVRHTESERKRKRGMRRETNHRARGGVGERSTRRQREEDIVRERRRGGENREGRSQNNR